MPSHHKACTKCKGRGKARFAIGKRARNSYEKCLKQFEAGHASVEPKALISHIETCPDCAGSGLLPSENSPKIDKKNYPDIAIIGGGIGGVAFALACLHRGIPYTLYERDESFDVRSQGYGLTLQQASKAIAGLGFSKLEEGVVSTRHVVHDSSGKIIGEWGLRKLGEQKTEKPTKRRNIHISRQALRSELLAGLQNTNIAWGYCLKEISYDSKGGIELEFQVDDRKQIAKADLVVGADGIHSCVRSLLIEDDSSPLQYLGCIVILGICPLDALSDTEKELLDGTTVFQTVNGSERIYMMPYDTNTIMWQLSFPMSEEKAKTLSKKGSTALKLEAIERLGDWHTPIPEILQSTLTTKITGYPVYDRKILEPEFLKSFGSITLLGDAMHPMSPFKGQGANQALLDALDLARDIATKCGPNSQWREKGLRKTVLEDFEKQMLARTTTKVRDSATAVKLLHSEAVLHDGDTPRGRGI